ncbi:hypothetical protein IJ556_07715 [bacterium]|nr:hypothetical protein [bacterium]MBR2274347.1 hypothetical protein [Alphaproteobacteria bacterium]
MYTILLSALILSTEPNQPTEVLGSAATPDGTRKEIIVKQPSETINPFGYIAPEPQGEPTVITPNDSQPRPTPVTAPSQPTDIPQPLISQTATTDPTAMDLNPIDYQNKIENTIYQDGNRLLDVQSIPIKDINKALTPNIQPTISDYPAF